MSKRFYESPSHSQLYAQCRSTYSDEIIKKILDYLSMKHRITEDDLAIDIGCGTDQSTVLLAPYFRQIIGYDISEQQINQTNQQSKHSNINYQVFNGKDFLHEDSSIALILSAQAAQWFDLPYFSNEVRRTLKPNGVLALFGYAFVQIHGRQSEQLNQIRTNFFLNTLGDYVQNESKEVYFGRYRDKQYNIPLSPTDFIRNDSVVIKCRWSIRRLLDYILSSSGTQHYLREHPESTIIDDLQSEIFQCLDISDDHYELDLSFNIFILPNRQSY